MFNKQNFCHVASNNRNEQKAGIFVYKTTDDLQTVLQSGYFNEKIIDINLHDLIIHEQTNATDKTIVERNLLCVVERTLENVGTQVIQSNWEKTVDETIDTIIDDIETIQDDIADIKEKNEDQDDRLDALEQNVAYKATDFVTPITPTNKGITQTEETAINNKIDLAANSGDQLTNKGVWYAKMYAATVAPSAEDGTNYADFSQTDQSGNPIIVLYERQNGAWVQTQTITPPAEYNGYVTITSKIWDIVEQSGQQGGKVLWAHNTKTFTPYPQIISFEDAALTGNSTVQMPAQPTGNSIVNVDYLSTHSGGTGKNVGDIFFTTRTDNGLAGAVECDGATYNTTDFVGSGNIGGLLANGKVPYVSLADYATALATNGVCGVYGWDGAGTTAFRVPSLTDIFVETGAAAQIGDYIAPGVPNIKGDVGTFQMTSLQNKCTGAFTYKTFGDSTYGGSQTREGAVGATLNAHNVSSIYKDNVTTVQPNTVRYRAMVQLATGATDEALETCTSVLTDITVLKSHEVIDFQAPTASNNYTWYRKYADGWVEQGGRATTSASGVSTITLPVAMLDTNYCTYITASQLANVFIFCRPDSTTQVSVRALSGTGADAEQPKAAAVSWRVSGMAAN